MLLGNKVFFIVIVIVIVKCDMIIYKFLLIPFEIYYPTAFVKAVEI